MLFCGLEERWVWGRYLSTWWALGYYFTIGAGPLLPRSHRVKCQELIQ
jgi:hypothetical protein